MFLISGLGNPGPRYELTRHNAGFLVLENLADKYKIKLDGVYTGKAMFGVFDLIRLNYFIKLNNINHSEILWDIFFVVIF